MREHSSETGEREGAGRLTIGLDLGDRMSHYCVVDSGGAVVMEGSVATKESTLRAAFEDFSGSRMAMEVGAHSPWVSRLLEQCGHQVIVANARRARLITDRSRKNDRLDARALARLARMDPELLSPIRHRSAEAQRHQMMIRARAAVVETRTKLVNTARGLVKAAGKRLQRCAVESMNAATARRGGSLSI